MQCEELTPYGLEIIAVMRPANHKDLGVGRTGQLSIYSKGYDRFDGILLCALILSRQCTEKYAVRLSPCFERVLTELYQEHSGYLSAGL